MTNTDFDTDDTANRDATNAPSDDPRKGNGDGYEFESVSPYLRPVVRFLIKFFWVLGRLVVTGSLLLGRYLTDRERHVGARRWLLLEGNRWAIVGGLVGSVFFGSFVLGLSGVVGIVEGGFITDLFGTIIAGLFSFVPIVVAVNQLTISELFGTPDRLREEIESVRAFRASVEERLPDVAVSPIDPGPFVAVAARVLSREAKALREAGTETNNPDLVARIETYVEEVTDQADRLTSSVDSEDSRLIRVLLPMMGDGYSENIHAARRIQTEFTNVLTEEANDRLADIREMYVSMDVIRQYFKALYIKQELARLSRLIAYTGLGTLLVSTFLILIFANGAPPGGHGPGMKLFVSVALAIAFSPFAVLFAFVIRIATIAKRTAAPGAFTPRGETPAHRREEW